MTEYVLRNGDIAVATLRQPETIADIASRYSADKLLVLKVDVRNKQDIANAFAKTKETFGRIDFVFNNAGYHIVSENSGREARDMLDVSFWGAVNVTKLAVKFLREANPPGVGGSILQMSFVEDHEPDHSSESCNVTWVLFLFFLILPPNGQTHLELAENLVSRSIFISFRCPWSNAFLQLWRLSESLWLKESIPGGK
jgi:hypothetical protein